MSRITTDIASTKRHLAEASAALDQAHGCIGESARYDVERLKIRRAFRLVHDTYVDLDELESDGELIGEVHGE